VVVADGSMLARKLDQPVAPERDAAVEVEVAQPVGGLDEGRTGAERREGEPGAVGGEAELDLLVEILADLEQAVADQCMRRLRPGQTVVTLAELAPALEEIGAVQSPGAGPSSSSSMRETPPSPSLPARSLQQVSQGAVISGVCAGLARYLNLNATLLRVVAVLLLLGTGGAMILVYLSLMVLLPYAPLQPGGEPIRWLPSRTRAFMEFVRVKLGVDRPRDVTA